jgi:hypothetical protein
MTRLTSSAIDTRGISREEWIHRTSIHESGHAVAAELLGFRVESLVAGDGGECLYATRNATPAADLGGRALVIASGLAAELLTLGSAIYRTDSPKANDDANRLAQRARGLGADSDRRVSLQITRWVGEARDLLSPHEARIEILARNLRHSGRLTGDEVRDIISLDYE